MVLIIILIVVLVLAAFLACKRMLDWLCNIETKSDAAIYDKYIGYRERSCPKE